MPNFTHSLPLLIGIDACGCDIVRLTTAAIDAKRPATTVTENFP